MNIRRNIRAITAIILTVLAITALTGCGTSVITLDYSPSDGAGRIASAESTVDTGEEPTPVAVKGKIICIDPGHGFKDGGSGGTAEDFLPTDFIEKDVNMAVALRLKEYLEKYGFEVVFSHDGKTIPVAENGDNIFNVEERTAYVNSIGENFAYFISLHCNVYTADETISGTRIYYSVNYDYSGEIDQRSTDSIMISDSIRAQLNEDFPDLTPQSFEDIYYVTKYTTMPSSLIEMGFITNKHDADCMLDEGWRDSYAKSIATGIYKFFSSENSTDK